MRDAPLSDSHRSGAVVFLVCLETIDDAPPPRLLRRLAGWHAQRCLGQCWMIAANTTSRIVYDSLADQLDDRDRILVSELNPEALWFNLRRGTDAIASEVRSTAGRSACM